MRLVPASREASQIRFAVHDGVLLGFLGALALGLLLAAPGSSAAVWALGVWLAVASGIGAARIVLDSGCLASLVYRLSVLGGLIASYLLLGSAFAVLDVELHDDGLLRLDALLFGVRWADAGPVRPALVVEYFSFFYLSYFAVLLGYAVPRALLGGRVDAGEIAVAMICIYCIGQALYVVVPAVGPGPYLGTTEQLDRGPVSRSMLDMVEAYGAKKDVFPSLHVAATLVAALHAYRHRRDLRGGPLLAALLGFVAANVAVATLVLRWHYVIDLLAGAALGSAAHFGAVRLVRWEAERRRGLTTQSAWLSAEIAQNEQNDARLRANTVLSA